MTVLGRVSASGGVMTWCWEPGVGIGQHRGRRLVGGGGAESLRTLAGERGSQLGQAMPPPLAEAVARAVVAQILAVR